MIQVSVVMAVYNGERYLAQALESILQQSFSDFEFCIVNDGSTDRTLEILNTYQERDKRVRVLQNKENLGLTRSLNKGIRAARGEYIARMDADDISLADRLELQVAFLDNNPDYGVVGSWYAKVDEEGKEVWSKKLPPSDEELRHLLIRGNLFPHASAMIRREALERVGLYNESWKLSQDYELWFRITSQYKLGIIPEFLLFSRMSASSLTRTRNRKQMWYALRAQWSAIQRGQYPKTAYAFVALRLPLFLVPLSVRWYVGEKTKGSIMD